MTQWGITEFSEQFSDEPGYLDFARIGPIGRAARDEDAALSSLLGRARFGSLTALLEQDARARAAVGELLRLPVERIVFQPNTSQAMTQAIFGLEGELVMSSREYPSLLVAAHRAEASLGTLTTRLFEPANEHVTPDDLREQLTPDTAAVVVSLVDFRTGYRIDLEAVREVIGDRLLLVDAVQGFGIVDAAWEAADVIASGGQKWTRAGVGTGFLAFSERGLERIRPVLSGFAGLGTADVALEADIPDAPREAGAFRLTHADPIAQARFAASLEEIARVGVSAIGARIAENVTRLIDLADEFGLVVASPRDESLRAGFVIVEPAPFQLNYLAASLHNHGVSATVRDGRVRFAPHATTDDETFAMVRASLISYGTASA